MRNGPWILSFSIPAGAIAFLINARRPAPPEPTAKTPGSATIAQP